MKSRAFIILFIISFFYLSLLTAFAGVIKISNVSAERQSPTDHWVHADILNTSDQTMETTVRSELVFYDQNSPPGDLPVHVLKKDQNLILKAQESRQLKVKFIEEGAPATIPLRIEPYVRIRREREWKY